MISYAKRYVLVFLTSTVVTALILMSQHCYAVETLLSGFEGDLSSTLGLDWQNSANSSAFVSTGATQGTQALSLTTPRTQSIPLKLFGSLDKIYAEFTKNTQLRADFTIPATANYREAFFRLQVNGGAYTIDGSDMELTPGATVTGIWDYQAEGAFEHSREHSTDHCLQSSTGSARSGCG